VSGRSFAAVGLALLALAAVSAHTATPSGTRIECGVERWTVKTLQDRPILLPAQTTTIAFLTSRPAPPYLPVTRLPFERHIFTVTAAVMLIRHEADDDYHVVLSDGRHTMIAESPAATCDSRAVPVRRAQMAAARGALRPCSRARVTGVAFFDFPHGQTGVAPNAIELHPILGFQCLTGSASAAGVGGPGSSGGGSSAGEHRSLWQYHRHQGADTLHWFPSCRIALVDVSRSRLGGNRALAYALDRGRRQ
jgi:hypothetical protein